jgi:hypothetical protein
MTLYLSGTSKNKYMDPEPSKILSENISYLVHTEIENTTCKLIRRYSKTVKVILVGKKGNTNFISAKIVYWHPYFYTSKDTTYL